MGRRYYVLSRHRHHVPIRCRGDVPLRRLGEVPPRRCWVFYLRRSCNVTGTYRGTSLQRRYDILLLGRLQFSVSNAQETSIIIAPTLLPLFSIARQASIAFRRSCQVLCLAWKPARYLDSAIVYEAIRTNTSQFFFFTKKFRAYKNANQSKPTNKNTNKRTKNNKGNNFLRIKTFERGQICCFAL